MSPSKRLDRKGRRRRAWAAPFVITMALSAPGCVVKEAEPTEPTQPTQPTQPTSETRDHRGTDGADQPQVISNPPPPQALPQAPTSGGKVHTRKDGTCWFHFDAAYCPENATCNPPPPTQVQCPEAE